MFWWMFIEQDQFRMEHFMLHKTFHKMFSRSEWSFYRVIWYCHFFRNIVNSWVIFHTFSITSIWIMFPFFPTFFPICFLYFPICVPIFPYFSLVFLVMLCVAMVGKPSVSRNKARLRPIVLRGHAAVQLPQAASAAREEVSDPGSGRNVGWMRVVFNYGI